MTGRQTAAVFAGVFMTANLLVGCGDTSDDCDSAPVTTVMDEALGSGRMARLEAQPRSGGGGGSKSKSGSSGRSRSGSGSSGKTGSGSGSGKNKSKHHSDDWFDDDDDC